MENTENYILDEYISEDSKNNYVEIDIYEHNENHYEMCLNESLQSEEASIYLATAK